MIIEFDIYSWRDIMAACGSVVSFEEKEDNRKMLNFINVICRDNRFSAYGCNGYQLARFSGACLMDGKEQEVSFIMPPQKTPSCTAKVQVFYSGSPFKYTLLFLDKKNLALYSRQIETPEGDMINVEKVIQKYLKDFDEYNHGEGQYMIAVNPKYLMNALQGVKDCDSVILNFGNCVQPFFIRPMSRDKDVIEVVLPIHMRNIDGRVRK